TTFETEVSGASDRDSSPHRPVPCILQLAFRFVGRDRASTWPFGQSFQLCFGAGSDQSPYRRESVSSSGSSNERRDDVEFFRTGFRPFLAAIRPRRAGPYNKPPAPAREMANIARTGPSVSVLREGAGPGAGWVGGLVASTRNVIVVVATLPASSSAFTMTEWEPTAHGPSTRGWAPIIRKEPPLTLTR